MHMRRRSPQGSRTIGRVIDALLSVSLFKKVLLANTVLVFVIAAGSTTFAVERLHAGSWRLAFGSFVLIAIASAALTLPIYALILRAAFAPLEILEEIAERVEMGDLSARAGRSRVADPRMARLTRVFDRLLDHVTSDRERLRGVAARALTLNEAERARIAGELEEDVVQSLASLMIRIAIARRRADESVGASLDEVRGQLAGISERVRAVARSVRPPALADLGLGAAITELARVYGHEGTAIRVQVEGTRGVLAEGAQLTIYRIVQESLRNALEHADARTIDITSRVCPTHLEIDIRDDGRGFDPRLIDDPASVGLHGMRERARDSGGTVLIDSGPGRGTRVTVLFPVPSGPARAGDGVSRAARAPRAANRGDVTRRGPAPEGAAAGPKGALAASGRAVDTIIPHT